jgi:hypothetical protein
MPSQGRARLKKGDITLKEILDLSLSVYGKQFDNKKKRQIDIINARVYKREKLEYDFKTRRWTQTGTRGAKFLFIVQTDPKSYKRPKWDDFRHKFPLYVQIRNINLGMDSPFRWRTGAIKKPKFPKKIPKNANPAIRKNTEKKNKEIQKKNIKDGIQLQFFFDTSWVLSKYGLLYGPDYTNGKPPKERNPKQFPVADKHFYFILTKVLIPFFRTGKGISLGSTIKR